MHQTLVTVTGNVVNSPEMRVTRTGVHFTTFRLASTPRWYNSARGAWESGSTNFYGVTAFRSLAANVLASLTRGQPVVVHGRLRVNQFERADKSTGTRVEIDAVSVGHDLCLGVTEFHKGTAALPDDHDRMADAGVQDALADAEDAGYDQIDPVTGEVARLDRHPADSPAGQGQGGGRAGDAQREHADAEDARARGEEDRLSA
ncbi:MAG: single-stranded DNA-binding protein [Nostocoides sp.]